jgi:hypothetical protein
VVPSLFVERVVTVARCALLPRGDRAGAPGEPSLPLPSIVAMAHQCFNCEYLHAESAEQAVAV